MSDVRLICGDCLDVLPTLTGVGAIVTDPPYGISYRHGARRNGDRMGMDTLAIIGDDAPFDPAPWLAFEYVVLWGANYYASRLPDSKMWLVWDKRDGIPSNDQADCELVWTNQDGVARLKTRYWNGAQAREKDSARVHPNQKPISLMRWCIETLKIPTSVTILDPYAGSGSTALACLQTGHNFIGIEKDPTYFAVAERRIAEAQSQLIMPLFESSVS